MATARSSEPNADTPVAKKRISKKPVARKALKKTVKKVAKPATKIAGAAAKLKKTPTKKPTKKIAKVIMPSSPEWFDDREPRPPRLSAVDRLDDPPPADGPLLIARVANAIERELTQIEIIVGNNRVPPRERSEAERRARTLASLARTLSVVTQLREKNLPRPDDDDDTAPRDLDELRDRLAQRLERLVAEQSQPDAGEPDAG